MNQDQRHRALEALQNFDPADGPIVDQDAYEQIVIPFWLRSWELATEAFATRLLQEQKEGKYCLVTARYVSARLIKDLAKGDQP